MFQTEILIKVMKSQKLVDKIKTTFYIIHKEVCLDIMGRPPYDDGDHRQTSPYIIAKTHFMTLSKSS